MSSGYVSPRVSESGLVKGDMALPGRPRPTFWQRRRLLLLAIAGIVVLALALGIGLGVGLNHGGGGGDNEQTATPTASSSSGASASSTSSASGPAPTATGEVWRPVAKATWQIELINPLNLPSNAASVSPDVEVYDIDLFTNSADTISTLKRLGKHVICYFSAGSYEGGRPDSGDFKADDKGKELDGWPGEYWLKLSSSNVRSIMSKRIALAKQKGCDAVDPDNVDGYSNSNGLGLTKQDSVDFVRFLAGEAATQKLSMGLKNAGSIIPDVLNVTDFSVNEQCAQYSECGTFAPFIGANKPVFHIEYPKGSPKISSKDKDNACSSDESTDFSTVLKNMNLDGFVEYCDSTTATTYTS